MRTTPAGRDFTSTSIKRKTLPARRQVLRSSPGNRLVRGGKTLGQPIHGSDGADTAD